MPCYRIDRIEEAGHRAVSAVRIEAGVYAAPVRTARTASRSTLMLPQSPVDVEFLDLPLLAGDEDPIAPHVAVARTPWAGPIAVFSADNDYGYVLDREVKRPAVFGTLVDPLPAARPGIWMRTAVRIRVASGTLQSRSEPDVLNGANAAALRFGSSGDWEVVQFLNAELVAPREYLWAASCVDRRAPMRSFRTSGRPGTDFILLDGAVGQLRLPPAARGSQRHLRVGPAVRSYDDPSYVHRVETFAGVGLRPYRPAHLGARRRADQAIEVAWMRRTRIDGDNWAGPEVPLGEDREEYLVRVVRSGAVVREAAAVTPHFIYAAHEQAEDGTAGAVLAFEVAQVSVRFGLGPFERIEFDG